MGYEHVADVSNGRTAFRKTEKHYKLYAENPKSKRGGKGSKKKKQEVDLSDVIDLERLRKDEGYAAKRGVEEVQFGCDHFGYTLQTHPGLFLIPNALLVSDQQHWIEQALTVFPEPPNRTNHDAEFGPIHSLWDKAQQELMSASDGCRAHVTSTLEKPLCKDNGCKREQTASQNSQKNTFAENSKLRQGAPANVPEINRTRAIESAEPFREEPVAACPEEQPEQSTDSTLKPRPSAFTLLRKLRWVTLGLQYVWSTRSYNEALPYAPFPAELADLAARLAVPAMRHLSAGEAIRKRPLPQGCCESLINSDERCIGAGRLEKGAEKEASQGRSHWEGGDGLDADSKVRTSCESASESFGHRISEGQPEASCSHTACLAKSRSDISCLDTSRLEMSSSDTSRQDTNRLDRSCLDLGCSNTSRLDTSCAEMSCSDGGVSSDVSSGANDHLQSGEVTCGATFRAEGAIVNFYGAADALSGHLDDVEENMDLPIVSISLGCKAVFLIGGQTRDVPPTAIFLRSGDVVLMAGPARRCYHGVPRIFTDPADCDLPPGLCPDSSDPCFRPFADYIATARININVRQVH